jgi:FMN-dependent NADH-azoreductase
MSTTNFIQNSTPSYAEIVSSGERTHSTLLHIDVSARTTHSISRSLSSKFIETWVQARPLDQIIRRDIGQHPPSFVTEKWIAASFTPKDQRTPAQLGILAESDELIAELTAADILVLGTPMYNYGMPAALKAWVDQVIRVNETFSFDLGRGDWPLEPILKRKILVNLTSKGEFGFGPGGPRQHMNFLDGHLETLAHYLGVEERHFIHVEYQEFKDQRHKNSRQQAETNVIKLAQSLAGVITEKANRG